MSLITRFSFVVALALVPFSARAQATTPTDTAPKKADSAAATTSTTDAIDKSTLVGFYEIMPGRGLTITLEKDELYGAPSSGEKRKLIYQSGYAFLVDGTKIMLTFIPGADGLASDLIMAQNGQTRMIHKTK